MDRPIVTNNDWPIARCGSDAFGDAVSDRNPIGVDNRGLLGESTPIRGALRHNGQEAAGSFDRFSRRLLILPGLCTCWIFAPASAWAQNSAPTAPATKQAVAAGFWEIAFSGGWIGIAIQCGIIALSMAAFYLVIEQILALRRKEIMPPGLADEIRQMLSQGRLPDADQLCRSRPSPLSFILISGLSEIDFGWPSMEKAMEDAIGEQAARLYRKIEYLSVIGNLAPMLGLLGTVTGMIFAFQKVAISQGTAGAGDLAEGIYSALATTVAGLVVAIPSLGAFAVLRNRVDQLIAEIAYLAQHVFSPVRRKSAKIAPRVVGPPSAPPRTPT